MGETEINLRRLLPEWGFYIYVSGPTVHVYYSYRDCEDFTPQATGATIEEALKNYQKWIDEGGIESHWMNRNKCRTSTK